MFHFRESAQRSGSFVLFITTDEILANDFGFEFSKEWSGRSSGRPVSMARSSKTRRNNRIVKVERRTVIGTEGRLEEKLQRSEDSSTLNTSFIERLNLTIRQGSAYFVGGRYVTPAGSNVWKGIWNYCGAITISSDRIGH
jgi:hypothetical protein